MTKHELKERLARLGRVPGESPVASGSPADVVIRPADGLARVRTIDAIRAIARRNVTLLAAKRAVEAMVENGHAYIHVPTIESCEGFSSDLLAAGVKVVRVAHDVVDVREIRDRLGLTQEQFAMRFAIDLGTLRNWEQGRYQPEATANAYLRVIARMPTAAAEAQEVEIV